jgi:hypothetical protein
MDDKKRPLLAEGPFLFAVQTPADREADGTPN